MNRFGDILHVHRNTDSSSSFMTLRGIKSLTINYVIHYDEFKKTMHISVVDVS